MARVLVVVSDADARDLFAVQLGRLGFTAECVQDGVAALFSVAVTGVPDVVILDLALPGEDSFDLFDRLLGAGVPATQILVMTAAMSVRVFDRTIRHGARSLWVPLTPYDLAAAIAGVPTGEDAAAS